jgi:hypothetical protein
MSLNRCEQMLCDYVGDNPDELRFWQEKVKSVAAGERDLHVAAARLADDLWYYFEERSAVVREFQDLAAREGLGRVSMRNLSEYWVRLWIEPRPKKRRPPSA